MELVKYVAEIPLFQGLPDAQLRALVDICVDQECKKGKMLFSEGSEATGFYVILSGKVKIFKLSLEGKEQILHIFGKGDFFGEVPVFAGGKYPAHAVTLEASRLLFFPRQAFMELLRKEPSLATNMLAILAHRLRRFTHLIDDLSLKEVPGRLAAYLLYLSDRNKSSDSFDLDITKGQLASLLGTIPETLSRIFVFIDHGTGVVIGETTVIGRNVRLYQGVTLGAKSFPRDPEGRPIKGIPRHPIVEDDVIVYSGATILGRITIGRGSVIGGNVWLTESVPPRTRVVQGKPAETIFENGSGI